MALLFPMASTLIIWNSNGPDAVADLEGVRGGWGCSVQLPWESKLFHFYEEFWENAGKMVKLNPLSKLEPHF